MLRFIKNSQVLQCSLAILFFSNFVFAQDAVEETEEFVPEQGEMVGCTTSVYGYFYNLEELAIRPLEGQDRANQTYQVAYNNGNGNVTIDFNICEYSARVCPDGRADMANLVNENNTCYHLTTPDAEPADNLSQLINEDDPNVGVQLLYPLGDKCNEEQNYMLTVEVTCNPDVINANYHLDSTIASDPCHPKVIMNSAAGCPTLSYGPLYEFMDRYWYLVAFPMIFLGAFLLVAGGRNPRASMFFIATVTITCALTTTLWVYVLPSTSPVWVVSITILIGLFMGAGLGFGAAYWPRIGILTIGLMLGALLGGCIYLGVVAGDTEGKVNEDLVFWMSVLASGVLVAIICLIFYDFAVIIGAALMGSYLFIRGFSFWIGGYPGEVQLIMNITNDTFSSESMSFSFMIYISTMALLFLISMIVQIKHRSAHQDLYSYKGRFTDLDYKSLRDKLAKGSKYQRENGDDEEQPLNRDDNQQEEDYKTF